MHEFFMENDYEGDRRHVDWVTAPGATIQMLHHMWSIEYGQERRPMNLLIVAGLNNILNGDSNSDIMHHLQDFRTAVKKQSLEHHSSVLSTLRVATLLLPPQLCWLNGDGKIPHAYYNNHLEDMQELNNLFSDFNDDSFQCQTERYSEMNNGVAGRKDKAPLFHTYGIRRETKKKKGKNYYVHTHRWSWWLSLIHI